MSELAINPEKLHQELIDAGLPAISVSSDGRVDYSRELTSTEKATSEKIISAHDASLTTEQARISAYLESGISLQDMVLALWDKVMQENSTSSDEIQSKIEAINASIN